MFEKLSRSQFLRAPTHVDIIKFSNLQLKNQKSGSKPMCGFSVILISKGTLTF